MNVSPIGDSSACAECPRGFGENGPLFGLLPSLVAPAGLQQRGDGDRVLASTEPGDKLGARALLEHYGAQLSGAGWLSKGDAQGEGRAWQAFFLRDESGRSWQAVLAVREGRRDGELEVFLSAF